MNMTNETGLMESLSPHDPNPKIKIKIMNILHRRDGYIILLALSAYHNIITNSNFSLQNAIRK